MLALRTSAPAFSLAEGERIAREEYGLTAEVSALSGERDCNLLLSAAGSGCYVLKILDDALDPGTAARLAAVLQHVAETDPALAAPRVIVTSRGDSIAQIRRGEVHYSVLLTRFLHGQHLAREANDGQLHQIGATLARIDAALQGFFHGSMRRPMAWDLRQLPQLMEWIDCLEHPEARDAVQSAAQALSGHLPLLRKFRSQAIHADCHAGNLLFDHAGEEICGLLDFGDITHAPVIFEPAIAMAELLMQGLARPESVGEILVAFAQCQRLHAPEVDLLFDLITARHASTLLIDGWRRRYDGASATLLPQTAEAAWRSLQELRVHGCESLTTAWLAAVGTQPPRSTGGTAVNLARRHRLLGVGAELFYEKPLHVVRGKGVWLFDAQGRAYLDAYNNVPHVGHSHPTVVAAVARQAAQLSTHTRYLHAGVLDYAEELIQGLPVGLDTCIFVNSGSEANDVAWRIAKMASGNAGALIMDHAYHGITDAMGALTPGSGEPSMPWVVTLSPPSSDRMPSDQLAEAESLAQRAVAELQKRGFAPAAWFIDSALTSSGIFDPVPQWAPMIARLVRAAGGLVVADEVQFGLGRSGSHFWSFQRRGLTPDIVTLGKPIGNGYPMGIVIANHELIETFQRRFGFFSTFGGNAVAAAAGSAVLQVLREEQLIANALETGEYLRVRLAEVASRHDLLGEPRGCGLLQGLVVVGADAAAAKHNTRCIVNRLAEEHSILIGAEGPRSDVLKLRPPMSFGIQHADLLVTALDEATALLSDLS